MYGVKWTAKFSTGSEAEQKRAYEQLKADYAAILAEITPEEIKLGLERCRDELSMPPVPAEFYQLAKRKSLEQGINGQAYKPLPSVAGQLPHKRSEADKAVALEALQRMRAGLASKKEQAEASAPPDPRDLVPDDVWFAARGWGPVPNPVAAIRSKAGL